MGPLTCGPILIIFTFFSISFLKEYEFAWSHMNFSCLKFWATLPLMSELRPFRFIGLSVNFSLLGTIPFGALCPSGPSALWGPLPFRTLCPPGPSTLRGPLPFRALCKCGLFGLQESLLFRVLYFLGYLNFWELC